MKTLEYQPRVYRKWVTAPDLYQAQIVVKKTDLHILADKPVDVILVERIVRRRLDEIEGYIQKDRHFLTSLAPIAVELRAPGVVKRMSRAARAADVGPMAAVAGAIAECVGKALLKKGYREVIIENGGDIFMRTRKKRTVGIYTGANQKWRGLSLKVRGSNLPLGICASSGTVGHSLSFGQADAAIVIARNSALADAAATAVANRVRSRETLVTALNYARNIRGVRGVLIIYRNQIQAWGAVELAQ